MIIRDTQFDHVSERKDQSKMPILIVPELQYVYLFGTGKGKSGVEKETKFRKLLGNTELTVTTYASKNILFIF